MIINGFSVIAGNTFATMYTKAELMKVGEAQGMTRKDIGGYFGGIKGSMNLIGIFVGAFVSPNLYMMVGFEYTCLIMGIIQLIFSYVFLIYTREENNQHLKLIPHEVSIELQG